MVSVTHLSDTYIRGARSQGGIARSRARHDRVDAETLGLIVFFFVRDVVRDAEGRCAGDAEGDRARGLRTRREGLVHGGDGGE